MNFVDRRPGIWLPIFVIIGIALILGQIRMTNMLLEDIRREREACESQGWVSVVIDHQRTCLIYRGTGFWQEVNP